MGQILVYFSAYKPEVFFKDMMKRVEFLPIDEFYFRPDLSKEYFVNANWALYCENYLEGFHIPFIKPGMNTFLYLLHDLFVFQLHFIKSCSCTTAPQFFLPDIYKE